MNVSLCARWCVCVCVCAEPGCRVSRHSCSRTGLMCNPSRHFKGRGAWADVVLLVYQMGLYDEKSVILVQASLSSHARYKAVHSILLGQIIFSAPVENIPNVSLSSSCISFFLYILSPSYCPYHPPLSPYFCSWRLANVALANILRGRQAIPFYLPGPSNKATVCALEMRAAPGPATLWLVFNIHVTAGHAGLGVWVYSISFSLRRWLLMSLSSPLNSSFWKKSFFFFF